MRVDELIEELKKYPPTATVVIDEDDIERVHYDVQDDIVYVVS